MFFLPDQRHQCQHSEAEQACDHRQRAGFHALHLLERQDDRTDKQREQHQARRIEARSAPIAGSGLEPQDQNDGGKPQRHVDQKNRSPAESLSEISAGDRTERAGRDRNAREVALIAAAFARRNGFADQSLRQRHQAAAAETLQHARGRQEDDAGRKRAQHRVRHEQRQARENHRPPAERVAQASINRRGDRIGDQIRHHDPRDLLDPAEIGCDRGNAVATIV